ncbi:MAG TPA: sterol desaturase family protein [Blastocatellia bacterium]|nr:sterol desaturase family protein [Blastocatellia bacterium]
MDPVEGIIALVAFVIFGLSILLEWSYWHRRGERKFILADSLANVALVLMQLILDALGKALFVVFALEWVRQRGLQLVPETWWAMALLFVGVDLGYYWFHRASHRVRLLWAIHVTHHSSELMNFTTALRQPPLEHLIDWLWFVPLAWIGFSPKLILLTYGFNLIYQFFIHTELVNQFPRWIEYVFNTPSHHRVHHGTNQEYLDMNYAGVFIIWDRLFGTFIAEKAPVRYGILHPVSSYNPFYVGFHLWADIFRDVMKPGSLWIRLKHILAPPGWPDEHRAQQAKAAAN